MEKRYDHSKHEDRIYKKWEKSGVFSPEKSQKLRKDHGLEIKDETYSVLMPPPNANAPLHCGHATYAIQDLMIRIKRMQGYKTCYFPGTDHAGFETQVVYERKLKKEGKSRFDFDRETLYNDIHSFVKENSDVAINQLKKLGMSCDWDRNLFMLDDFVIDTVFNTFQKMHKEDLIYRDNYLVNYSPTHGTTFSNLETEHVEKKSSLYYVNYKIKDSEETITVATTRPETIPADVAIAVNPKDSRYKNLVGKTVLNPLNEREMKIIADSYVDVEFGTGALKITPGHDANDFEIGQKHGLDMICLLDLEGKLTKDAGELEGLSVNQARGKVEQLLEEKGLLKKIDKNYVNKIIVDYKDKQPIEPMLLPNWFVKMDTLAKRTIEVIKSNKVKYNLPMWKKETLRWLDNIKDWPISRQTVFGIRIPVWYSVGKNKDMFIVFLDNKGIAHEGKVEILLKNFPLKEINEGLQKLIVPKNAEYVISKKSPGEEFLQETDTFDTWFSSGQWPLTTLKYPDGKDYGEFYPTSFMDSMWDILFFWIVRMIMFGLYLTNEVPYKQIYIHGRIDDEKGQKMSKSKGNVIDPIKFVDEYGSDALRMGMLVGGNTAAKTTSFNEDKIKGYRNFANKLWNMTRFMGLLRETCKGSIPIFSEISKEKLSKEDANLLKEFDSLVKNINSNLNKYRFMDMGNDLYHFIWHTLADKYIEHVKIRKDKEIALSVFNYVFIESLKLLHPFMPFVTELVWENIQRPKSEPDLLAIASWPKTAL